MALAMALFWAALPFLPKSLGLLGVWVLTVGWLYWRARISDYRWPLSPVNFPVVVLLLIVAISTAGSVAMRSSLVSLAVWATYLALFFLTADVIRTRKDLGLLLSGSISAGAVVAVIGIVQYFTGVEGTKQWLDPKLAAEVSARVVSVLENPNVLAEYLTLLIPLTAVLALGTRRPRKRVFLLIALGLMAVAMTLTFSRAGWIATAFAVFLVAGIRDRRIVALLLVLALIAPLVLPHAVVMRAGSVTLEDPSNRHRVSIWTGVVRMIRDYWPAGVGPGLTAFQTVYRDYLLPGARALHSHNLYLQVSVELGVFALASFLWAILVWFGSLLRSVRVFRERKDGYLLGAGSAVLASLLGLMLHGLFDYIWFNPKVGLLFWGYVGLGVAISRMSLALAREGRGPHTGPDAQTVSGGEVAP